MPKGELSSEITVVEMRAVAGRQLGDTGVLVKRGRQTPRPCPLNSRSLRNRHIYSRVLCVASLVYESRLVGEVGVGFRNARRLHAREASGAQGRPPPLVDKPSRILKFGFGTRCWCPCRFGGDD
jgi:hypothetical protein